MAGFDFSDAGAPLSSFSPASGSVIPCGSQDDPIFVEALGPPAVCYLPTGFKDAASGLPILAQQSGDAQVGAFALGYISESGSFVVSSGVVAVNAAPEV